MAAYICKMKAFTKVKGQSFFYRVPVITITTVLSCLLKHVLVSGVKVLCL